MSDGITESFRMSDNLREQERIRYKMHEKLMDNNEEYRKIQLELTETIDKIYDLREHKAYLRRKIELMKTEANNDDI